MGASERDILSTNGDHRILLPSRPTLLPEMMEVSKPEEPAMTAYNEEDVILITGGSRGLEHKLRNGL
ncbi:hypothetical protein KQR57_05345 [Bacillus inaquosorum]|nr:hypothetical protein [Bacillus inaquosorum]